MSSENQKNRARRSYEKPALITIDLAADEVLAVGCKLDAWGIRGVRNFWPMCRFWRVCFAAGT